VGGYLSRVSPQRKVDALADPVMRALLLLSEGRQLPPGLLNEARAGAPAFRRRAALGYVVIETSRATPELRQLAIEVLDLVMLDQVDGYELYAPRTP
jgi:hypothetical protein